ncbi:cysteine-rich CWC family protein [Runella limosa]|uniref:cysteine-rich CWC family protein n=1 Tax=Runella limosa TaxID=370978 RepID=UPI000A0308DD
MATSSNSSQIPVCPRCGQAFRCQLTTQGSCVCSEITLSEQTLSDLRTHYEGCLCLKCLQEIARASAVLLDT